MAKKEMTFGERLKMLRQKRNMSQFEISLKSEIPQCLISWYETNRVKPTLEKIKCLCVSLNVSATELLGF